MSFLSMYYENEAREAAKKNMEELNKTEVGKFVLCKTSDDSTGTRMFINRFTLFAEATKDGWWDTFTISSKPCEKHGLYICTIDAFKIDKNGFLMMIVTPNVYLPDIEEESVAWKYLTKSGVFADKYDASWQIYSRRFNVENLHTKYAADLRDSEEEKNFTYIPTAVYAKHILNKLFANEISFDDIEDALNEMDPMEKLYTDIIQNPSNYTEKYPLMMKKMPRSTSLFSDEKLLEMKTVQDYIETNAITYGKLHLGEDVYILDKVEAVLQYYEEKKLKEKEERKNRRKQMKGQVNE